MKAKKIVVVVNDHPPAKAENLESLYEAVEELLLRSVDHIKPLYLVAFILFEQQSIVTIQVMFMPPNKLDISVITEKECRETAKQILNKLVEIRDKAEEQYFKKLYEFYGGVN